MAKYVSLYEKLGFRRKNITLIPTSTNESISLKYGWRKLREKAILNKANFENGADVVHIFSGGK